jgi:hypothetical protein
MQARHQRRQISGTLEGSDLAQARFSSGRAPAFSMAASSMQAAK